MSQYTDRAKSRFSASAADTNGGGVTATEAAPSDTTHYYTVTGIQASGDAAALVTIESPASTVLYRKRFAGAFTLSEQFEPGTLNGAAGQAVLVKVSASTTNSEANIQGFEM